MQSIKRMIGLIFCCFLTACAHTKKDSYMASHLINPTAIPGGLSRSQIQPYYPLPDVDHQAITQPVDITPPTV